MTDTTTLATNVGFTDEDIINDSKKTTLAIGWYRFLITGVEKKMSRSGHMMLALTCNPLEDPTDANSTHFLRKYHNIVLPLKNGDDPNHKAPKTAFFARECLRACLGEGRVPNPPTWKDGVLYYKNEPVDAAQEDTYRQESSRTLFELCRDLWLGDAETELINCAFYAETYENDGYVNLRNFSIELPAGESLVPAGSFEA